MNEKHYYLDLLNNTKYDDAYQIGEMKEYFNGSCGYCNKVGHKKIDCWHLKGKQEKKGNILMIETNIIDVPMNSWWLDTEATIHVTNSL